MKNHNDFNLTQFKCMGCGACCRQTGYVRLTPAEPDTIAEFLGMDVRDFIEAYTCLTRDRIGLSLIDAPDGACIFLDKTGCRINQVKPRQCRDFPIRWRFSDFADTCAWARQHKLITYFK